MQYGDIYSVRGYSKWYTYFGELIFLITH